MNNETLKSLVTYNPETGKFYSARKTSKKDVGDEIVGWEQNGYIKMTVGGSKEYAHRLAWAYMTGEYPKNKIDHIDGDRKNNKFCNLRKASDCVNAQNIRSAQVNNKVGLLGVYKKRNKYVARIYCGKQIVIGSFDTPHEAHSAYVDAKRKYHEGCTI